MKALLIAAATLFLGIAATPVLVTECERLGNSNNFRCDTGDKTYKVENVNSAKAAGAAIQGQLQGQAQNQTQGQAQSSENTNINNNSNDNSNSSSISNVIEGNPAHTTSFNVGVGISVRLGEGVRARAVVDAADWLADNGQKCLAVQSMLKLHPDLKRMKKTVNC